jgi:hypothetical protein
MAAHVRREALEVGIEDGVASRAQLADGVVEVDRVTSGTCPKRMRPNPLGFSISTAIATIALVSVTPAAGRDEVAVSPHSSPMCAR